MVAAAKRKLTEAVEAKNGGQAKRLKRRRTNGNGADRIAGKDDHATTTEEPGNDAEPAVKALKSPPEVTTSRDIASASHAHSASEEEEKSDDDDDDDDGEEAEGNDEELDMSAQDDDSATSDAAGSSSLSDSDADSEPESDAPTDASRKRPKRDDPSVFATSLSKILHSKLSTAKRADPLLARSKVASAARREVVDARVEAKARHKLRDERRTLFERGRIRDVLGVAGAGDAASGGAGGTASAAEITERERRLKKIAQRGVVKLFNAVRAAQVQGEQAAADAKKAGVISAKDREARVNEMSKQGFLDLIAAGGARSKARVSSQA